MKDRLQEMKMLMQGDGDHDDLQITTQEKSTPLIIFFEHARAIKLDIQNLKNKVTDLKILLGETQDWRNNNSRKQLEHKVEEQKLIVGNLAKTIQNNIKSMKTACWDSKGVSVVQRIKDVQFSTILAEFNEILIDYLQCLGHHRERLVKIFKDMLEVKGEGTRDIDTLLEEGKIAIFTNNLLIGDMEEKLKLREAEEEHNEIIKIESSILEIRNLFNELALIVDLQSEKVLDVEKLVDKNVTKVENGKAKLTSASKKNRKLRYKKLLIALICGGLVLMVLVVIAAI